MYETIALDVDTGARTQASVVVLRQHVSICILFIIDICGIIDFIIELNLLRGDYEDIFDECSVHLYLPLTLFVGVFMSYSCYLCLFTYGGV